MTFIKETNVNDYANMLQATLQREYDKMCYMLKTCKNAMKDGTILTGVMEYRARKYEVEHIASILGFDLDEEWE